MGETNKQMDRRCTVYPQKETPNQTNQWAPDTLHHLGEHVRQSHGNDDRPSSNHLHPSPTYRSRRCVGRLNCRLRGRNRLRARHCGLPNVALERRHRRRRPLRAALRRGHAIINCGLPRDGALLQSRVLAPDDVARRLDEPGLVAT